MLYPLRDLQHFDPAQHFAPDCRGLRLAVMVKAVDLHRSHQERPLPVLCQDSQSASPQFLVVRHLASHAVRD